MDRERRSAGKAAERLSRLAADPPLGGAPGLVGSLSEAGVLLPAVADQLEKIYAVVPGPAPPP